MSDAGMPRVMSTYNHNPHICCFYSQGQGHKNETRQLLGKLFSVYSSGFLKNFNVTNNEAESQIGSIAEKENILD
jgi:hypothetical protein